MKSRRIIRIFCYICLTIYSLFNLLPILWVFSTAFKTRVQSFSLPPIWIPDPITVENFQRIFTQLPFANYVINSLTITFTVLFFQILIGVFASYAFARLKFPGRDFLFVVLLTSLMIPQAVTMIPQYIIIVYAGWINTHTGVVVPQIFMNVFGIFLLRQYFLGLPGDFEDAARIDGAGIVRTFLFVMLPQVKPAVFTVAILSFMRAWNNFLWPLVIISSNDRMPLSVGLSVLLGQFVSDWAGIMAGAAIALLPVLLFYIFAQRYFVQSIYMTGIK